MTEIILFNISNFGHWNYLENKFVTPTPPRCESKPTSPLGGGGDGWGGIFIVRACLR